MKSRRRAREAALQALYQSDTLNDWSGEAMKLFFVCFYQNSEDLEAGSDSKAHAAVGSTPTASEEPLPEDDKVARLRVSEKENREFCVQLVEGVCRHLADVDREITASSLHWSLGRMSRVDRNILRLATFEIMYLPDVPVNVSINEAIELAKVFGSDDSPMFVNGVLDNVAKAIQARGGKAAVSKPKVAAA